MTEEELLAEIDSFLLSFKELPIVKRYLLLKEAVKKDEHLLELERKINVLQKGLKYMKDAKKDECIKACNELQIEHDNDPLYVNYKSAKDEIFSLLSYLDNLVL